MANMRKVKLTLSNVSSSMYHDGQLKSLYNYLWNDADADQIISGITNSNGKYIKNTNYESLISQSSNKSPIILNYQKDEAHNIDLYGGYVQNNYNTGMYMSYYRREYDKYTYDGNNFEEYKGEWEPVAVKFSNGYFRDFNIKNDHIYQYIAYNHISLEPNVIETDVIQIFANNIDPQQSALFGEPVFCKWNEWSIIELLPVENPIDAPIVKKAYKANLDQLWLFKYDLQVGPQTQNISRNDIQTLGQFNKLGYSEQNFISGDVTALMGSEIVAWNKQVYTERLWRSRENPLSTNEKVKMLEQWRKLVASKNPKLLKDMKGQSWIVQIVGSSNTPKNGYYQQPDSISFQWKQIESLDHVIIYGDSVDIPKSGCSNSKKYTSFYRNPSCCQK